MTDKPIYMYPVTKKELMDQDDISPPSDADIQKNAAEAWNIVYPALIFISKTGTVGRLAQETIDKAIQHYCFGKKE